MPLQKKLQDSVKRTEQLILRCPWENKQFYGWWLSQTYYFVRHTSRFLSLAAGCAKLDESYFHAFFLKHIPEELGHEKICLTDLKSLQLDIFPEAAITEKFHSFQRDKIITESVANHLGYMLFLENLSITVGAQLLKILKQNYPDKGLKFLRLHTEEDIDHVSKALDFANELPTQQKLITLQSIEETCESYNQIIFTGQKLFAIKGNLKKVA